MNLAGFNIDTDHYNLVRQVIDEYSHGTIDSVQMSEALKRLAEDPVTPETLSAAYARISRSDKDIHELRRNARASVNRARKSNEQIIFGFGHSSVAEHAVFNLDIGGISRLCIEELEAHRLASFTESSQRYIRASGGFIIPDEILEIGYGDRFTDHCRDLFKVYRELTERLEAYHAALPDEIRTGRAREDARYVLPLSCRSQVGVTINARVAELLIRTFNRSPLQEVRLLGRQILEEVRRVAPSLIRYTEPKTSRIKVERELKEAALVLEPENAAEPIGEDVTLLDSPNNCERHASAAILFCAGQSSYERALSAVDRMTPKERRLLLIRAHGYIDEHEPLRREMELGYFTFGITLSSSAFAQLKRHRMATLIKQDYNPTLGATIPPAVEEAGCDNILLEAVDRSTILYNEIEDKLSPAVKLAAQYALTNAHRRRAILQANARELTHLARLREDADAQWDIRRIANAMIAQARDACPGLMMFACGKDRFPEVRAELFRDLE